MSTISSGDSATRSETEEVISQSSHTMELCTYFIDRGNQQHMVYTIILIMTSAENVPLNK